MPPDSLQHLYVRLHQFAAARDWEQYHTPKNLAMALAGEAGELLEHFQWLTPEQSLTLPEQTREEVALEMADILIYLIRCADRLGIDLVAAANRKIEINEGRFPPGRCGSGHGDPTT
jgi:dCTP diphosphatase